jgi:3,4-dihydroxy 2-butanone 4-phosphate synthase / GTP cyclohydrolase II
MDHSAHAFTAVTMVRSALPFGKGTRRVAAILSRVHSSCFTSEALGALDCDCAQKLDMALEAIASRQCGVIFYLLHRKAS